MNISIIFLASFMGRDWDNFWNNNLIKPLSDPGFSLLGALFEIIAVIIAIIVITAIAIFFIKFIGEKKMYVSIISKVGFYRLIIGDEHILEGNISEDRTFLNKKTLKLLKRVPKLEKGIDILEEMFEQGILKGYDIKITNENKIKLISDNSIGKLVMPGDIKDPKLLSWPDQEGEWSIAGKRFPINLLCSELTEHVMVEDYYGNKMDVWVLVPYTRASKDKYSTDESKIVKIPGNYGLTEAHVNLISLPEKEALAKAMAYLPTLSEIHTKLEIKNEEVDNLKEEIKKLNKENESLWIEINGYKALLKSKPIIGFDYPIIPLTQKSAIAVAVASVWSGYMATKFTQIEEFSYLKDYDFIFAGVLMIIIIAILKSQEKEPPKQQRLSTGVIQP